MASIEEQFVAALVSAATNLASRIYPNVAPDSPVVPYAVYLNVVNKPEVTLADGVSVNNTHIQVTVWDKVYANAKTAAAQVVSALQVAAFTNLPLSSQDVYEASTKRHGVRMEYSVWY